MKYTHKVFISTTALNSTIAEQLPTIHAGRIYFPIYQPKLLLTIYYVPSRLPLIPTVQPSGSCCLHSKPWRVLHPPLLPLLTHPGYFLPWPCETDLCIICPPMGCQHLHFLVRINFGAGSQVQCADSRTWGTTFCITIDRKKQNKTNNKKQKTPTTKLSADLHNNWVLLCCALDICTGHSAAFTFPSMCESKYRFDLWWEFVFTSLAPCLYSLFSWPCSVFRYHVCCHSLCEFMFVPPLPCQKDPVPCSHPQSWAPINFLPPLLNRSWGVLFVFVLESTSSSYYYYYFMLF